ncbi:hypothetical protein Bca52824_006295 [Brassica carinata]|uniref:C-JID domain-containing protein n=1 Tax=Brassica carinata TaxID=52824 RepID=A0A8X7WTK7_BRACI|nr:hypothetical protein Bca52824_006295 [Brassica carinata]
MNLTDSVNLKELPDLSTATNLEILSLTTCWSLIKLPSFNGNSLEELDISGCSSLVEFPSFIGNAVNLRKLDLRFLPNLMEIPSYIGNATNLEKLDLSNCSNLVELPLSWKPSEIAETDIRRLQCSCLDLAGLATTVNAVNLLKLDLSGLPQLLEVPLFIGKATNLEFLNLSGCSNLVELPIFIGNLQKLQRLRLKACSKLEVLPTNINLESLDELDLFYCYMLKQFPQISANIRNLNLFGTTIKQVPPSIRSWPRLDGFKMSYFENLKDFPHALERITELWLTDTKIQEVPLWVKKISRLRVFVLMGCRKLLSLPPISDSIRFMDASDCESLEVLECSFHNPRGYLNFSNCFKLNQEARDLIIKNSERAILPGGQVPAYFTHRATGGDPLTIKFNGKPLPRFMTFKGEPLSPSLAEHLYTFQIEAKVTSSELLFEFKLDRDDVWKIGEYGLVVQHLEISTNIGNLILRGTAIEQVPPLIRSRSRLDALKMSHFENLKDFPHALERITELWLSDTEIQEGSKSVIGIKLDYYKIEEELDVSEKAFEGMSNLQFLKVSGDKLQLTGGLNYLPHKLRLLEWSHFPMSCFPCNVNLEFLVELVMIGSKMEKLWEGIKTLRSLKWMDLSDSVNLKELPDLSTATNLEKLYLLNLLKLNLDSFPNLVELPSYVGNATNLENLNLSNCSHLVELPLVWKPAEVADTDIKRMHLPQLLEVPSFIGNAINLEDLILSNCSNLVELPLFTGNLQKLKRLRLEGCSKLEVLPTNINLESLFELNLNDCSMLKRFPEISTNIRNLYLIGTAIEQVPPSIRSWSRLDALKMSYFENLKELPHALERITCMCLTDTEIQEVPPWVKKISRLSVFVLKGCRKLVTLPAISESIRYMDASDCESLEMLECSFHNPHVELYFTNCFKLNQEARDLIIQNSCRYVVLPGGQVPPHFTHRATGGGPLTIKLNEKPLPKYMIFRACILLVNKVDHDSCSEVNSMEVDVIYHNSKKKLYPALAEHLYLFESKRRLLPASFSLSSSWK